MLFGVSGGIAAYKAADYARGLCALGARVIPILTRHALEFVSPLTFAALTGEEAHTDLFAEDRAASIPHVKLARSADLILVAPATANILAKAAHGLADDLLTTLLLSATGPVVFCPSMNPTMFAHLATQANLDRLSKLNYHIVKPGTGMTACGEKGRGRMAEWPAVRESVLTALTSQNLEGTNVLVAAGPTREAIDPVRFLSNRSSGRMGYAVAQVARRRGARVTLVSGPVVLPAPPGIELHQVENVREMEEAMKTLAPKARVIVMTAAVADYTPSEVAQNKIKKDASELVLRLVRTPDILTGLVKERRPNQLIVGFCAETHNLESEARRKVRVKGVDLLVANDVSQAGAGFDVPTNRVLLITPDKTVEAFPLLQKEVVAEKIWDRITALLG